ncbi:MAG: hypothetical protein ACLTYF_31720, partial [Escherichia sp.]
RDLILQLSKSSIYSTKPREAYRMLMNFISFDGPEYRLTEHGRLVINLLNTNALKKNKVRTLH